MIANGAIGLIENFSISAGDTLDLQAVLAGASASNLANPQDLIGVSYTTDPWNNPETVLSITNGRGLNGGSFALIGLENTTTFTLNQLLGSLKL